MRKLITIATLSILVLVTACDEKKEYLVTITTDFGEMKAVLFDETPKHKENFLKLAEEGFYDSLLFHRVIEEFMIQGGDPDSKLASPDRPLGNGGPGYTVPSEFNYKLFHKKGALAAARQPDQVNPEKASSGSQFYIVQGKVYTSRELGTDMNALFRAVQTKLFPLESFNETREELLKLYENGEFEEMNSRVMDLKDVVENDFGVNVSKPLPSEDRLEAYTSIGGVPHLDDQYTVFGQVISGLEVIDKIASQNTVLERGPLENRPTRNIRMQVDVKEVSRKKITKEYGFEFE